MVKLGNLNFHILPRQQDQKRLQLEQRNEHRQMVEVLDS
jgi:hypothetical protein